MKFHNKMNWKVQLFNGYSRRIAWGGVYRVYDYECVEDHLSGYYNLGVNG